MLDTCQYTEMFRCLDQAFLVDRRTRGDEIQYEFNKIIQIFKRIP